MTAINTTTSLCLVDHGTWIRVYFSDAPADHADYHYLWLRHNCELDRHPTTNERIVCSSDLPFRPRPEAFWHDGDTDALQIRWAEDPSGRVSSYPLAWLRAHAYSLGEEVAPPPPSDTSVLSLNAADTNPADLPRKVVEIVDTHGLAVVRNYGPDTEALIESLAAGTGLQIRGTHFGRIEDLRTDNTTNKNTDQLGYTNYPVRLHTDQPFLEVPPKYQLLQCMRKATEGGENYVADALQAARYIQATDRQAFDLLSTVPIKFHRKQKDFERSQLSPLLDFSHPDGFIVRYSYFTMAPHHLPFALMENWYRAYNTFAETVNNPEHQYQVSLEEGDFLFYNNRRMLHARNGFSGPRWMRGIYFDPRE